MMANFLCRVHPLLNTVNLFILKFGSLPAISFLYKICPMSANPAKRLKTLLRPACSAVGLAAKDALKSVKFIYLNSTKTKESSSIALLASIAIFTNSLWALSAPFTLTTSEKNLQAKPKKANTN